MWKHGMDPDSSAIPYLTAAGDLIGTALLGLAFHILNVIGDGDSDVGDWYHNMQYIFPSLIIYKHKIRGNPS